MFTGIVSDIGTITRSDLHGDLRLIVQTGQPLDTVVLGASIACSGACLTVVERGVGDDGHHWFAVDVSGETVARTAHGMWTVGRRLNLERALRVGDELGGHIVTGHVDGVGTVRSVEPVGDSWVVTIGMPEALAPLIAAKGSVTADGVSLTVNSVAADATGPTFTVNLIPHTRAVTTLNEWAPGRAVNLEIDVLARYLDRMLTARGGSALPLTGTAAAA